MTRRPARCARGRRREQGNALILALLALVVTGLAAVTALQNKRIEIKREAGLAEASVLETLRNGAQAAVHEHLAAIQLGQPITKEGVTVVPSPDTGELIWAPTIAQLRDMGYLPSGWTATRSSLNEGAYQVSFRRIPSGCQPVACDVDGLVVIAAPVVDSGRNTPVDGVVIGPILTRAGADGGVSLATAPATIFGFNGTWSTPNPVPGSPPGVVAMRFGTQTGGFSQFVRVGDLRDPNLGGNLSAAGDLSVGGAVRVAGPSVFGADLTTEGDLRVGSPTAPCITLTSTGILTILCTGTLSTTTGVFEDRQGNRSEIGPDGVVTRGAVEAITGFRTPSVRLFEAGDPNAIRVESGELFIRGPSGNLVSFSEGQIIAPGAVSAGSLHLTGTVQEGATCSNSANSITGVRYGSSADQSLAVCVNEKWVISSRIGRAGASCGVNGALAADAHDGQSLICRSGLYLRTAALMSNFVLLNTYSLDMSGGYVQVNKPSCLATGGAAAESLIILSPNNEDVAAISPGVFSGINRYAIDEGSYWTVVLERSYDRTNLPGNLIASIYCFYPS